jgi:predicted TIM-barrel fold metal-dependent hydrolase
VEVIDGQLHEPGPSLSWPDDVPRREDVLTEMMATAMEAVGVHGAVLFPTYDVNWAIRVAERDGGRFAVVPMVTTRQMEGPAAAIDPTVPDIAERLVEMAARPGVKAFRAMASTFSDEVAQLHRVGQLPTERLLESGAYDGALATCEEHGIPLFLSTAGRPDRAVYVAERFPDLVVVIDHLALAQVPQPVPQPWDRLLPDVLELARFPQMNVKLCGLPSFSTEAFPYRDVQRQAADVVAAFGAERVLWASDISRFEGHVAWTVRFPELQRDYQGKHTYSEALRFILDADWLSTTDKEWILGRTVRRILSW